MNKCLAKATFAEAWPCIEAQPHGGGHGGVGGEVSGTQMKREECMRWLMNEQMVNPVSSPGDPLFYLHHTWLDKVWADWQARNKTQRIKEIGGTNVMPDNQPFPARPSNIP